MWSPALIRTSIFLLGEKTLDVDWARAHPATNTSANGRKGAFLKRGSIEVLREDFTLCQILLRCRLRLRKHQLLLCHSFYYERKRETLAGSEFGYTAENP